MEKWVIIGLEHLVFPEDKAMLKKAKGGGMREGHRCRPQRAPNCQSWNNLSNKINKAVLDYHPKKKVNIHESIWTNK